MTTFNEATDLLRLREENAKLKRMVDELLRMNENALDLGAMLERAVVDYLEQEGVR